MTHLISRTPYFGFIPSALRLCLLLWCCSSLFGCLGPSAATVIEVEDRSQPSPEQPSPETTSTEADDTTNGTTEPSQALPSSGVKTFPQPILPNLDIRQQNPRQNASPAVLALLDKAKQMRQQGAYASAKSQLERALNIEPQNPQLYYELANISLLEGQYAQTEQLARKGLSVSTNNATLSQQLWNVIAKSRRAQGDEAGALQAETQGTR